jgi:MATE family multidrug resistance protein
MGLVWGIDPFVSQAHGANDGKGTAIALQRGLVLALLASIPLALMWLFTEEVLVLCGQDLASAKAAERYALVRTRRRASAAVSLDSFGSRP